MKKASSNVKNVMDSLISQVNKPEDVVDTARTMDDVAHNSKESLDAVKKPPRITISFTPDNLEFLQAISRVNGMSIAKYVNKLVEQDKIEKESFYKEARELLSKINK